MENYEPSKLELQLGEMIGTVKMTVNSIETLRISIERLAERAAFKGDVDSLRIEMVDRLARISAQIERDDANAHQSVLDLERDFSDLSEKVTTLQKIVYVGTGVILVLGFLSKFVEIPVSMSIGGG